MLKLVAVCAFVAAVSAAVPATADAPTKVRSRNIVDGAVRSVDLHRGAVTPRKLSRATRRLIRRARRAGPPGPPRRQDAPRVVTAGSPAGSRRRKRDADQASL